MPLDPPKAGIDVRDLRAYVEKLYKILNSTTVKPGKEDKFIVSDSNAIIQIEGEWYSLTLCDGTTLKVRAKDIVPPA